jgi:hypothetical protein
VVVAPRVDAVANRQDADRDGDADEDEESDHGLMVPGVYY